MQMKSQDTKQELVGPLSLMALLLSEGTMLPFETEKRDRKEPQSRGAEETSTFENKLFEELP